MSDWELIQEYAKTRSEAAFSELVARHLSWVYSVAMRKVGNSQLAEEVAQSVFILLAVKARSLRSGTVLNGWLFRTTCFVGSRALRSEHRQKHREQIASSMTEETTFPEEQEAAWEQLAPRLDEAVASLSEGDRAAILLRFYEKKSLNEVGCYLGISEEAAKKRVSRAVDKMRSSLLNRGVSMGATAMLILLTAKVVQAAPLSLAASIIQAGATGLSASAVLPALARETFRAWRWAKIKLAAGLVTAAVVFTFVIINTNGFLPRGSKFQRALSGTALAKVKTTVINQVGAGSSASPVDDVVKPVRKSGALTGLVLDNVGRPVSDAKVWGGFSQQPYATDTTDASGQFALNKIAGPWVVTVTAEGFAADQQEFDIGNASGMFIFRLTPIRPLLIRLVDESGAGVPGVRWSLANWWGRPGTLGWRLDQRTDDEGHWRWLSPPRGEIQIEFGKVGYCYSRTNKVSADGVEHTIVLHPDATVRGSVTDAESGAAVSSFTYTVGHSQPWFPADQTSMWDFRGKQGSNGFYKFVFDEEQVPYLRIEAEGYETVETELHLTNGVESIQDFQLKARSATNAIRGRVLLPDGSPAAGVEVALCTQQAGVMLRGVAFEPGAFGNLNGSEKGDYRRTTDEHGSFSFAPKPGAHTLVAAGATGLGQVRCFHWSKPIEIRLQAWGRVNGTVRTRDGPYAGCKVKWIRSGNLTSWMTVFYRSEGFAAESNASGEFTLENVPPGAGRLVAECGAGATSILSPSIQVNPGETVHVDIGGMGRSVTGKLVAPAGLAIRSWQNQVRSAELHREWESYNLPKDLKGNEAEKWKLEFEDTEAGRTWFREQLSYNFKVEADGSFTISEALPGKYLLFIDVAQGYLGSGLESKPSTPDEPRIASASMRVTVPGISAGDVAPVDLGEIVLNAF